MEESSDSFTEAVIETLTNRGWCFGDIQQVKAIIFIHCALSDDRDASKVADSLQPELLNMDLRSIGGNSLPDPNRKPSHIQGPKVLQIASARDISRSSIEDSSGNSSSDRLLRLTLTDGHTEITAIEYSHVPSLPNDVVPGTKVRLENKVVLHGSIICLKPKAITVLGGVVQSLHEEWQMNKKYSAFSRTSLRLSQESDNGGPPPFEKLQIGVPSQHFAQRGRFNRDYNESTSRNKGPVAVETVRNSEVSLNNGRQTTDLKPNSLNNNMKTTPLERMEEKPSSSEIRPKEVAESFPVQNQAASQKLLQKMNNPNRDHQYSRGRKGRGKGREEEPAVFTLDEWEKRKAGAKPSMKIEHPDISHDEDLAWQLQNQLDLEDSHVQKGMPDSQADNIKLNMFNYEREDNWSSGTERGGRGRGRGRGGGRGRGRGRGRGKERGRW
ncbi:hypothetical protein LWI29_007346 [Acer saccharum]|uniref:RecQ mediated genome instability protein 1 OB-fold domain-containing protein n=1 Tax=Acer saccharum TaxID=4024 RepID=A0AA39RD15_ACESA|nr:hypothetical protein LWI29_007346 [Acer saccharum]